MNDKDRPFGEVHAAVISGMRTWRVNGKHDFAYPLDDFCLTCDEALPESRTLEVGL